MARKGSAILREIAMVKAAQGTDVSAPIRARIIAELQKELEEAYGLPMDQQIPLQGMNDQGQAEPPKPPKGGTR